MDVGVPFSYDSYSNRFDPHDEVDDSYAEKAFWPDSDQTVLLRRRYVRNKRRGAFDTARLCFRVLILLLDLSILGLTIHGLNVWDRKPESVDRNGDDWTRTQWSSVKMVPTWLMLAIAILASFVQTVAIATHFTLVS